jgi:hypothetical protein
MKRLCKADVRKWGPVSTYIQYWITSYVVPSCNCGKSKRGVHAASLATPPSLSRYQTFKLPNS